MDPLTASGRSSVERQAAAYLKAKAAREALATAEAELSDAEQRRYNRGTALTVTIDGQTVTSWQTEGRGGKWHYVVSESI